MNRCIGTDRGASAGGVSRLAARVDGGYALIASQMVGLVLIGVRRDGWCGPGDGLLLGHPGLRLRRDGCYGLGDGDGLLIGHPGLRVGCVSHAVTLIAGRPLGGCLLLGFVSDAVTRSAGRPSGAKAVGLFHIGLRLDGWCGLGDRAARVSICGSVGPDHVILAVALGRARGGWSAVGVADIAGESWLFLVAAALSEDDIAIIIMRRHNTNTLAAHTYVIVFTFLPVVRSQPYMRYYPCTGTYRTKKATGVLRVSHKSTEKWRQCLLSKSSRARSYRSNFRRTNQSYRCSADGRKRINRKVAAASPQQEGPSPQLL